MYADAPSSPLDALRAAGVPVVGSLETACQSAGAPLVRAQLLRRSGLEAAPLAPLVLLRPGASLLRRARRERRGLLLEPEVRELLAAYGVSQALEMLDELRLGPVLRGFRGAPAVDRRALVDLILGVARCVLDHPEIDELEANPVFAYRKGAVAVDARAYLGRSGGRGRIQQPAHRTGLGVRD